MPTAQSNPYSYYLDSNGTLRDTWGLAVTKADPNVPMGPAVRRPVGAAPAEVDPSVSQYIQNYKSALPTATVGGAGGAAQDRVNIDYLLNPYFDTSETRTNAAEKNLGAGVAGSGFGLATTNKLLDSERIARFQLGHQMLEPYLQRDFQAAQAAADRQARLNEIATQGAQALQQLQLQEAGLASRLTQEENAQLQRQVLSGQQAMQQLLTQEAGQTGRTQMSIAGNLANTRLGIGGDILKTALTNRTIGQPATPRYVTDFDWASQTFTPQPVRNPAASGGTAGPGVNTIDSILRRYGLLTT